MANLPTVAIDELSNAIADPTTNEYAKRVQQGILDDYMDLQYGKETPYTTGKRVVPVGATIEDVDRAIADETTEKIFKDMFGKISTTHKSGDFTPQSKNDGTWDPKLTPVFVFVTPRKF